MNTRTRNILKGIGAILSLAIVLNFYLWIYSAFSTPSKSVSIYFDSMGEGNFELVMYLVLLPFLVIPNLMVISEAMKERLVTIPMLEKRRRLLLIVQILVSIPTAYFLPMEIGIPLCLLACAVVIYYNLIVIPAKIKQLKSKAVTI